MSVFNSANAMGHTVRAFPKGFYGQIHSENTELNKVNQILFCRPFQSLCANVDLQERYNVCSIH